MFAAASGAAWRKRMQDLSRQAGPAHPPLFSPLLYAVAARIEAVTPMAMCVDGTRIRKNVSELRRVLGTDVAVCAVPSGIESEALGVPHDLESWPPRPSGPLVAPLAAEPDPARIARARRLGAALDAIRQLQADASEPVVVVGMSGPGTVLSELRAAGAGLDDEAGYAFVGNALAAIARLFAEAGAHALRICERLPPAEAELDHWKGALGTIGNVARFHRVPPLLTIATGGGFAWPPQMTACPAAGQAAAPPLKPHGRAWSVEPSAWPAARADIGAARLVTTIDDVPCDTDIAGLRGLVAAVLER